MYERLIKQKAGFDKIEEVLNRTNYWYKSVYG